MGSHANSPSHAERTYVGGALVFGITLIGLIAFFVDLGITKWRPQLIAWYSAAAFVFLSFIISMATVWTHLVNYRNPRAQRFVVRIVVLVPLYSVQSWLSLRFHDLGFFFGSLRDCYEAYVIFCFFAWLLAVQGGEDRVAMRFNQTPTVKVQHPPPVSWAVRPWVLGRAGETSAAAAASSSSSSSSTPLVGSKLMLGGAPLDQTGLRLLGKTQVIASPFLLHCQAGVFQYVVLKLCLTFVSFGLESLGAFGEGEFTPKKGWIYISVATNMSQMWAMYCLVRFYAVCAVELRPFRPVGKLLSVKAVVFFTYSQSCAIALVLWMDMLPSAIEENGEHWSSEDVGRGLQDWLICIEMLLAAVVFADVFSPRDYKEDKDAADHSVASALLLLGGGGGGGADGGGSGSSFPFCELASKLAAAAGVAVVAADRRALPPHPNSSSAHSSSPSSSSSSALSPPPSPNSSIHRKTLGSHVFEHGHGGTRLSASQSKAKNSTDALSSLFDPSASSLASSSSSQPAPRPSPSPHSSSSSSSSCSLDNAARSDNLLSSLNRSAASSPTSSTSSLQGIADHAEVCEQMMESSSTKMVGGASTGVAMPTSSYLSQNRARVASTGRLHSV